ncbi:MAG: hypothetical protein HY652_10905 [Acidobacteria bacterium]|nr:hypothetical protein [Acidobacteriota bacterium]
MIRVKLCIASSYLAVLASTSSGSGQPFTLSVQHEHLWGHCAGKLVIHEEGMEYATENSKHSRKWRYEDLRRIEISSPREVVLHTYEDVKFRLGADKKFRLELRDGDVTAEIYEFLLARASRPLVTRVLYPSAPPAFTMPVKHRHRMGGCQGQLKAGEDRIIYETPHPGDSRIWFYKDIESIGLMDAYSFRLTTLEDTYTFDLKVPMSPEHYDFLWAKVYRLAHPYSKSR